MNWLDVAEPQFRYKWVPELDRDGDGVRVHEYLNETLQSIQHARDEALKTTFIQYLRMRGYIVIEPEEREEDGDVR